MVIDSPPSLVTVACVEQAAQASGVPPAVLLGVMAHEGGRVGGFSRNSNGSVDYGPMQINSVWLKKLKNFNITADSLQNNGCVNVYTGAWILKNETVEHGMTWEAVGAYHSETLKHKVRYVHSVSTAVSKLLNGQLSVQTIINRANGVKW